MCSAVSNSALLPWVVRSMTRRDIEIAVRRAAASSRYPVYNLYYPNVIVIPWTGESGLRGVGALRNPRKDYIISPGAPPRPLRLRRAVPPRVKCLCSSIVVDC